MAMTDDITEDTIKKPDRTFAGFSEIDQAIRDNRLMDYRIKKSWADPWGRMLTIGVIVVIVVGFSYLIGTSLELW